jgi:hypothetical protein
MQRCFAESLLTTYQLGREAEVHFQFSRGVSLESNGLRGCYDITGRALTGVAEYLSGSF